MDTSSWLSVYLISLLLSYTFPFTFASLLLPFSSFTCIVMLSLYYFNVFKLTRSSVPICLVTASLFVIFLSGFVITGHQICNIFSVSRNGAVLCLFLVSFCPFCFVFASLLVSYLRCLILFTPIFSLHIILLLFSFLHTFSCPNNILSSQYCFFIFFVTFVLLPFPYQIVFSCFVL